MNAAPRPHVNNARPQTTQDLMIILIQRVKRLERELKERTSHIQIHKVDRGRYRKSRPKNNYTHKSMPPGDDFHKTGMSPTKTTRLNMNAAPRPHVNNARPQTTQDLMVILIQRVKRLERELKARTSHTQIHKVDRGRY
nr:hypothetical protein [Tanacetum cinerariifolium]